MPNSVFYVEDDPTDIFICNNALAKVRCTVKFRMEQDSRVAADWLLGRGGYADRRNFPVPAVLVTDLKMPYLDGFQLIAQVRANEPTRHLPIIAMSTSDLARDKRGALEAGANIFLTKTSNYFQFLQTIRPFVCPVPEQFCTKRRFPEICQ